MKPKNEIKCCFFSIFPQFQVFWVSRTYAALRNITRSLPKIKYYWISFCAGVAFLEDKKRKRDVLPCKKGIFFFRILSA
jgi:hypothetical protein